MTAGMAPFNSTLSALFQVLLMSPLRIVGLAYLKSFDGIVLKCMQKREKAKAATSAKND